MLDKRTWAQGVLPQMAFRMGLDLSKLQENNLNDLDFIIRTLPDAPMVSPEEWQIISEYYAANAPDSLTTPEAEVPLTLERFSAEALPLPIPNPTFITMVEAYADGVFIGTRSGSLYRLTNTFQPTHTLEVGSPPSDVVVRPGGGHLVAAMGIMDPNDQPAGKIIAVDEGFNADIVADSLKRPVDIQVADLNLDGKEDLVVSAFGNFTGGLYVLLKQDTTYRPVALHRLPGTRKTIVTDFNDDGLPDLLALVAQGDEHIILFINRGNLQFSQRVLLRFPPVYGSSYFELADFNGDGHPDILFTNGDNADYSPVLKPYHGVRIFMNDGFDQFTERLFYPMHGASKAMARDFDGDGDMDIAAISFFPDFERHPERGFIYLENKGGKYTAQTTALASASRWLVMDALDLDHDTDLDLVIGGLGFTAGVPADLVRTWSRNPVSLLVLYNQTRSEDRSGLP